MATDKDTGSSTFEKNTFGPCKQQPVPGGYKPCQIVVAKWSNFYNKITLEENKGKALLEDSKATCPIGGPDCIEIINHGQKAQPGQQQARKADLDTMKAINPAVNMKELRDDMDEEKIIYAE